MEFDPMQFILQGTVSLLASIFGVTIWAWLAGIYKTKGEITGRAEMIPAILNEVRLTAKAAKLSEIDARTESINNIVNEVAQSTKAAEGAKIETRLEKLDQILHEVGAVTDIQKRIEARVSRSEWDRQWRLQQLRDAYGRVLGALFGLADYDQRLLKLYKKRQREVEVAEDWRNAEDVRKSYLVEFWEASSLMRIFAGGRANKALDIFEQEEQDRWNNMDPSGIPYAQQGLKNITGLQAELTLAAQEDLVVSTT